MNLEFLSLVLLFYGVTTLEQPIFLQIQYSMLALSMLRLIFTLFEIWLLTVHFSFVFYLAVISLLTSLQSLYLPPDLLFFGVRTKLNVSPMPLSLRGRVKDISLFISNTVVFTDVLWVC